MNTVTYVQQRTGETQRVKVGQGGADWLDQNGQRRIGGSLPAKHSRRRPTVAEVDRAMASHGFVRRVVRGKRRAR